jgi:hypothetical protein
MRTRTAGCVGLFAAGLLAVAGCSDGGKMADVSGTVTVDGKTPEKGSITFIPADGKSQTAGADIIDGKYTARVPVGKAKVEIRVPKVVGKRKLYNTPDSPYQETMEEVLPAKYNNKTELTFDVQSGSNEKNWELNSKGK